MPIYEYECAKCQEVLEISQRISEPPLTACPQCGSPIKKLISRTTFQLKGGGWYQSDYGGKGGASKPAAEAKAPESKETPKADPPKKSGGGCGSGGCGHGGH